LPGDWTTVAAPVFVVMAVGAAAAIGANPTTAAVAAMASGAMYRTFIGVLLDVAVFDPTGRNLPQF
jgi:hypothetical protein